MSPLLEQGLSLIVDHRITEFFLEMMPIWSPDVTELNLRSGYFGPKIPYLDRALGSHKVFSNLTTICLYTISNVKNCVIEELLKGNRLLKRIELSWCYQLDGDILQLIAKYAPQIEILRIEFNKPINHRNSVYFGLLRKLKTLTLNGKAMREFIMAVLHELATANIHVEQLNLVTLDLPSFHRTKFVEGKSKLKTLKILHLNYVKNLNFDSILGICMELTELTELHLKCNDCLQLTSDNLVKLIETCEKLHRFQFSPFEFCAFDSRRKIGIEFDTFMKMVHIIQQRRERISCKIILESTSFYTTFPKILTDPYQDVLTLNMDLLPPFYWK